MMKHKKFRCVAALLSAGLFILTSCSTTLPLENPRLEKTEASTVSDTKPEETEAPVTTTTAPVTTTEASTQQAKPIPPVGSDTPVGKHGALSVKGTDLVDQNGEKYQLYGMSTHGIAWFPKYINYDAFLSLRDEWNTNCIRIAMYTDEYGGYCNGGNQLELKKLVQKGVDLATELGMYVIIDWHILHDQTPKKFQDQAISFFSEMSELYKNNVNVIYEICNEPNGNTSWQDIKEYADQVIPVIRKNDSDAIIIVGTPTWSQDVDKAAASPLSYDNVMYALHFYADTHTQWLRDRAENAIQSGLPIFISEFSICDASGNGRNNHIEAALWKSLIDTYNISYIGWNLANKNESSSVFTPDNSKTDGGWTQDDLSESGKWMFAQFTSEPNR